MERRLLGLIVTGGRGPLEGLGIEDPALTPFALSCADCNSAEAAAAAAVSFARRAVTYARAALCFSAKVAA